MPLAIPLKWDYFFLFLHTMSINCTVSLLISSCLSGLSGVAGECEKKTGTVYTRWGKSTCPETAELLYTGYTGGTHFHIQGGAANHLCLPNNPEYSDDLQYGNGTLSFGALTMNFHFKEHTLWCTLSCVLCAFKIPSHSYLPWILYQGVLRLPHDWTNEQWCSLSLHVWMHRWRSRSYTKH